MVFKQKSTQCKSNFRTNQISARATCIS